jgi:hypothetical protein
MLTSTPTYRGFCSDGYYFGPSGKLMYAPPPDPRQARVEQLQRELAVLDIDATLTQVERPAAPMVVALEIDGRRASPEQVRAIETTLGKVPKAIIRRWHNAGGRVELVAGNNASVHPRFAHRDIQATGWCDAWGGRLLAVAADGSRPERTALHELGHGLDLFDTPHPWQYSSRPEWAGLANRPFGWYHLDHHHESNAAELFAESFSRFCFSPEDREGLTNAIRAYIGRAIEQFVEGPY